MTKRLAFPVAVVLGILVAAAALLAPAEAAKPGPQPGCNERCKPFLVKGGMKCYFVGCDVDGICRYIC